MGLKYSPPLQFAGVRFILSGLMVLVVIRPEILKTRISASQVRKILLIGFIQTFLQYALFYTGIMYVPGAISALVIGSGPLFVALVAHFSIRDDLLTGRKIVAVILGILGVAIISIGSSTIVNTNPYILWGILILLANNLLAGIGNVIVSRHSQNLHPLVLSSLSMIVGGIMLLVLGIITEDWRVGPFPLAYYLSLAWLSFLSAAAISIWYSLLKKPGIKVSELNMWKFIIPLLGAVLSWVLLPDESPNLTSLLGMVLIAAALMTMNLNTSHQRKLNALFARQAGKQGNKKPIE